MADQRTESRDPLGQEAWTDRQQEQQTRRIKETDLTPILAGMTSTSGLKTESPADMLEQWWTSTAISEVKGITDKMREYGGHGRAMDLIEIGRALRAAGMPVQDDDASLAEAGCYFYLVGKFARWTAAISEGRRVSDDTLYDIGIYIRMVQRIRQSGGWPV